LQCKINPRAAADGLDNLHVRYFNPSTGRPPRPWSPVGDALVPISEVLEIAAGEVRPRPAQAVTYVPDSRERSAAHIQQLTPVVRAAPGSMPTDFEVPDPETLQRLDDHDCIAVVMMENRSYDHFFHDLPRAHPAKGYQPTPPNYRNTPPPGFKEPFSPVRNISIGIGNSLIFTPSGRASD